MIKRLFHSLFRTAGFELLHADPDPVLKTMRRMHQAIRLQPPDSLDRLHLTGALARDQYLRSIVTSRGIDTVLDVGANVGQFGRLLREIGYEGPICSFEPMDAARAELTKLASAEKGRWTVLPYGLSSSRRKEQLNVTRDSTFSSLDVASPYGSARFGGMMDVVAQQTVELTTLDEIWPSVVASDAKRVMLKCDTQGHDLEVLQGAVNSLRNVDVVLTEATFTPIYRSTARYTALEQRLQAHGFKSGGIFPVSYDPRTLELIEADVFYVREDCDRTRE